MPAHRPLGGQVWAPLKLSCVHFSLCLHAPKIFCRFLRHIGTFLDHLRGVDTPAGRVPVPKHQAKLSKYIGDGRSISQLLLRLHAPNFSWRFMRHIETFLDYLGDVDTPMGRVPVPRNWAKLSKYMWEWGGQYLSFY